VTGATLLPAQPDSVANHVTAHLITYLMHANTSENFFLHQILTLCLHNIIIYKNTQNVN